MNVRGALRRLLTGLDTVAALEDVMNEDVVGRERPLRNLVRRELSLKVTSISLYVEDAASSWLRSGKASEDSSGGGQTRSLQSSPRSRSRPLTSRARGINQGLTDPVERAPGLVQVDR